MLEVEGEAMLPWACTAAAATLRPRRACFERRHPAANAVLGATTVFAWPPQSCAVRQGSCIVGTADISPFDRPQGAFKWVVEQLRNSHTFTLQPLCLVLLCSPTA